MAEKTEKKEFNHRHITEKWQKEWDERDVFKTHDFSKKKKFYLLEMFPYPSASGLHMGHALNYTIGDIYTRFKIMQGFNVLHPMGFDSFGLPAENAAIKAKAHPRLFTEEAIKNYIKQMKGLGLSYDWERLVETHKPDYYKWDQWIFLKMYEKGLAYKKKSPVNWCPKCNTVLANEQVHSGKCWRHEDTEVEVKNLEQWFFKTTAYAEELYDGIENLRDWPEVIKKLQKNWIGKSTGTEIQFRINNENWTIFTTRADTLMGVTFLVISAQHPRLQELVTAEQKKAVDEFLKTLRSVKQEDIDQLEKEGVFTGSYAIHPLTNEKIPVYAGNFVLADYGSGMVMAVPAHDQRDYEFAKKYGGETESNEAKHNCVLIHGCTIYEERAKKINELNWLPWVKKDLIKNNVPTETPLMPDVVVPDYDSWKKELEKNNINESTILVGYSCGASFLVRWLGDTKRKINKLILVAPRKIVEHEEKESAEAVRALHNYEIDLAIKNRVKKIMIFTSDNEIDLGKESVKIFHDALGGEIINLSGRGHYTSNDMGTEEFPELVEEIMKSSNKGEIKIKWVIMPSFGKPQEKEEKRYTITAVIKRKSDNKYLLVKWKQFDWIAPVVGGIDEGETPEQAAEREVLEETGFKTKAIKKLGGPIEERFYAENKKVWRHRIDQPVLLEIVDDKQQEIDKDEKDKLEVVWMTFEDAMKNITHDYNKIGLKILENGESAFTDYGVLVNSGDFDGLTSEEAKEKITAHLEKKKLGKKITNYRLRDWLISRQRFWGTPIPVVYCEKCGTVPVKEEDLPVTLPDDVKFLDVKNPLTTYEPFLKTHCPKCNGPAKRETDTMDTFVNSSWYYLRYTDPKNKHKIFDKKLAEHWAPVDLYIGGKEHACMHLIYIRFYTKFFRDIGLLEFDEPAIKLFNQGMLQGPDGEKMSKSKGNVVLPETVSHKYGLDAARLFLVSVASPDKDINWSDKGVEGSVRFLNKIINYTENVKFGVTSKKTKSKIHQTIKEMTENIEALQYNIAVIKIRELFDSLEEEISKEDYEICLRLLSPFCPHTCEELWEIIGNKPFIVEQDWPESDDSMIDYRIDYFSKLYETLRGDINDVLKLINVQKPEEIKIILSQDWKYSFVKEFREVFAESKDFKIISGKMLSGELKKYGQEIMKMLPGLIKDPSKLPGIDLSLQEEKENLENNKEKLEAEYRCKIIIELADSSSETKARNAWPGKPALVVK
ncbi:MAG: class I tRNA ligase family protein [Candidatus Nanoarchaeia archaeon]